jgi:hypothetical protein
MASTKVERASAGKSAKATGNGKVAKTESVENAGTLNAAMLKIGRQIWQGWVKGKLYVNLGIREKTATKTGTRAAMLAVAAFGYKQGEGKILAQAVRAAQGNNPNVGGIDFPWLEKAGNMATITSSAAIRLDAKDGKMRLLPITVSKATRAAKATATVKRAKASPDTDRTNGNVTVSRMSAEELATLQAE